MTIDISPDDADAHLWRFWADKARTLTAVLADYQKGQTYRYIGKDGLPILARDLEDQRDAALAALTEAETNINLKADFIERTLNDLAAMSQENYDLKIALTAQTDKSEGCDDNKNEPLIDYQNLKVVDDYSGSDAQNKRVSAQIRSLTPADSKAALDRMIAEAEERGMRKAAAIRGGSTGGGIGC